MKITFLTTGGTIDKDYAPSAGTYNFTIAGPAVRKILKQVNPNFEFDIIPILKKDSLDMNNSDRQLIYDACTKVKGSKIIITHGSDTMSQTAQKIKDIKNKTIILVGSSRPEKFINSDASFNVGAAVGAINCLNKGVHIAMNGRIYKWSECYKQKDTGRFVCRSNS